MARRGERRWSIRRIDITYVLGLGVAIHQLVTRDYNPTAMTFAAGCLGVPILVRWDEKKRNGSVTESAE